MFLIFEYYSDIDSKIVQSFNDDFNYVFFFVVEFLKLLLQSIIVYKKIKEFISPFLYFLTEFVLVLENYK